MKRVKIFLVALITIILTFVFSPLFSDFFEKITTSACGLAGFLLGCNSYFEGFFISYSFFITLMLTIFGGKNKYRTLAVLLLIIFLIQLGSLESLIVSIGAAVIAWLIAQAILVIKKKISKK